MGILRFAQNDRKISFAKKDPEENGFSSGPVLFWYSSKDGML